MMYIAADETQDVEEVEPTHQLAHDDTKDDKEVITKCHWEGTLHIID